MTRSQFLLLLLLPAGAPASTTASWELTSYQDFVRGRFAGVSLSRDGRLMLAPRLETLYAADQPVIWSLAQVSDGTVYAGTGHRGQVVRVDNSGRGAVLWTAEQPEVFAVALDSKGVLYAGTSPNGRVYRIEDGKAVEFFNPGATYIWALAFSRDGSLFVATGDQGKVFRVEPGGKGELFYETGQTHVTCLALDREGRLLAGTDPNGILYRIAAKDKGFVLYDANLPEIHSIAVTPDGAVYAAGQGGSAARRGPGGLPVTPGAPAAPATGAATTTITVTDEAAQCGVEIKPRPEAAKPPQPAQPVTVPSVPLELAGIEKSAVYRILPDHTVETLWTSKDENAYDILPAGRDLLISTDGKGRIYRLSEDQKVTLLVETNESEATRLLATAGGLLAATANLGRLFRLGDRSDAAGMYESPVHDAGTVAHWGRLNWRAELDRGARLQFRTRSGNSMRPDRTWSDWSEPLADPGGKIISPSARYIQWKAEFTGDEGKGPALDSVTVAYLPQNTPPSLKSIQVTSQTTTSAAPKPAATSQPATAAFSITVTDTGEAPATSTGTPTQALQRSTSRQMQVSWQAEDTDGDRLVYALYFRGEDEREWKLVKDNLYETAFTLDGDVLADGRYFFRVDASDAPANPPASARKAELTSAPVLVDNTPPAVTPGTPKRAGGRVEIQFEASDASSPLRRAEYSVDAGPWTPVEAGDGIIDAGEERFLVRLESVPPGEHLVVLRVYDSAENAGLAKVVVR